MNKAINTPSWTIGRIFIYLSTYLQQSTTHYIWEVQKLLRSLSGKMENANVYMSESDKHECFCRLQKAYVASDENKIDKALKECYENHALVVQIMGWLHALLPRPIVKQTAEDVVQELWIKLDRYFRKHQHQLANMACNEFVDYCYRSAKNKCIDTYRKHGRLRKHFSDSELQENMAGILAKMRAAEYETELYEHLMEVLNEIQLRILKLTNEGYPNHEIATLIDRSEKMVYNNMTMIRHITRKWLQNRL